MPRTIEPLEETATRQPRRRLVLVGVGLACLVVAAGALFAVLRSDGTVESESEDDVTEITFNAEDAATSLLAPPPGTRGQIALNSQSGPAGSKVRVQGVSFKAGKEYAPIEIYFDTVEGKPLATAEGPRFAIDVTIPSDAKVVIEGHNIIVVQRTKAGEVVNRESQRFFVLPG